MYQIDVSDNLSIEVIPNVDETHPPTIRVQDNFNSEKYCSRQKHFKNSSSVVS
jgi:hypothetical protein